MLLKFGGMVAGIVLYAAIGSGLYALAGKQHLPFLWAVLGIQLAFSVIGIWLFPPELIRERMKPRGKDKDPFGTLILSVFFFAQLLIAVLDCTKWHLSDSVPLPLQLIALVVQAAAWAGLYWSMYVNQFFSSAIRIQNDRGQTVISTGPYAWIRHPGYAFAALAFIFESFALGSWLSAIPAILISAHMAYRTTLEEKMLAEELPGYVDYSQKVRYRWVPGVW